MATKKAISLDNNTYWDSSTIVNENNETLDGMFSGNKSMGNIVVDSIIGKNMFDKDNVNKLNGYINNAQITTSANAKTLYVSCKPSTTYTISKRQSERFIVGTTINTPVVSTAPNQVMQTTTDYSATSITITTNSTANYIVVYYYLNGTDTLTEQQVLDSIQIEKGTTATTYAPYQELNPNNFKNEEIIVGSIRSKNMFDETQLLNASGWSKNSSEYYYGTIDAYYTMFRYGFNIFDNFEANTQYTLSLTGYVSGGNADFIFEYTDNTTSSVRISATSSTNYTLTSTANKTISKIKASYGSGGAQTLYLKNVQLEKGTSVTTYAPYQELNNMDVYSTNEVKIGTWIDGKPLYRKVIKYTNSSSIGTAGGISDITIPHGISNFSQCVSISGVTSSANILPTLSIASGQSILSQSISVAYVDGNNITLRLCNWVLGSKTFYFTMVYAKSS